MTPDIPSLLGEVELQYTVPWPLGAVVTSNSLRCYSTIHRFLLHSRLTSLELKETWTITRKAARQTQLEQASLKCCDDVFYKTQSLVGAFNEAFVTKVNGSFCESIHHDILASEMTQVSGFCRCFFLPGQI